MHGVRSGKSSGLERARRALKHGLHLWTPGREVTRHAAEMVLLSPVEHGGHNRNTHAPADVARQIHQTRRGIVLILGEKRISGRVDGDKQECHPRRLDHSGVHQCAKINSQSEVGHVEQREGEHQESAHHQLAGVVAGEHKTHQWHQQHQAETTRQQCQPGVLGGIAQHGLHEERQEHGAAEQGKSQHEHQHVRSGERPVGEQVQVDYRVFAGPFPVDEKQQRADCNDREDHDKMRFKPVVALSFVQDNLQRTQAQSHQTQANVVDLCF